MNFVKADGSSVTSFHTGEPAVGYNNKAKHLQGTMLGNFTNVPVGFESWVIHNYHTFQQLYQHYLLLR